MKEAKGSTTRTLMKTELVKRINENMQTKMIQLINDKIDERNYMKMLSDFSSSEKQRINPFKKGNDKD